MKEYAVAAKYVEGVTALFEDLDQYYSVEISIVGLGAVYQFKIWKTTSASMFILVKENSCLLPFLSAGDRLKMRYYSTDMTCPYKSLVTKIQDIVRHGRGRLRGHYLVEMKLAEENSRNLFHLPSRPSEGQKLPFNVSLKKFGGN